MNVIILADYADGSGGAPAVAVSSAIGLAELGIQVAYVHAVAHDPDPRLGAAGVVTVPLGLADVWSRSSLAAAGQGVWNAAAARRLTGALAEIARPGTVLHLHQWTKAFSPAIFPVLLRSGLPLAVTLHDYFLSCPTGLYYRFDHGEPCTLRPLSLRCVLAPCDPRSFAHKIVRVARAAATRAAASAAPFHVVHVSERGRETIAPLLPAHVRQHRVDNPVEAEHGPPLAIPDDAVPAFVGRLTPEKGALLAAEACAAAGVPAFFIGDGPCADAIRRLHRGATVTGWLPRAEVDSLLRTRVRAVLAPSLWYETGPLTVREAMAIGLPSIVSDRAGSAEAVGHGETGLVVPPDPASFAAAIRRLADIGEARRLGRAAYRRFWDAPPTRRAHAEALRRLYGEMLSDPPRWPSP